MISGVTRMEALVDAIGKLNGMSDPSSDAYQLRNPLMLRAYSLQGRRKQAEANGTRRFDSLMGGYRAAIDDLDVRCSGRGRATDARRRAQDQARRVAVGPDDGEIRQEFIGGKLIVHMRLTPESPLSDLLGYYGLAQPLAMKQVVNFLRRALWDDEISPQTKLQYFTAAAPRSEIEQSEVCANA